MNKTLKLLSFLFLTSSVFSQVGINTNSPKTTFDVSAKRSSSGIITDNSQNYGIQLPTVTRLELTQNSATYGVNQKGAMIYVNDISGGDMLGQRVNVTTIGYYYFDGTVWKKLQSRRSNTVNVTTIVNPNILGYTPSTTATATSVTVPAITGTTVSKVGTVSYNGHSYAIFLAGKIITWYEAYNAAKSLGGYLATFTTDDEWKYVETNLITPHSEFSSYAGWIGFAKYSWFAGSALTPNPEMKWITGEQPNHDYTAGGTNAIRKSNWFKSGEPNNSNGTEGFVHFHRSGSNETKLYGGYTSTHPWNDVIANNTSTSQNIRAFIVEFQQ